MSTQNPTWIAAYAVSRSWTGAPTWATYDGIHSWATPGGDANSTPAAVANANTSGMTWPITSLVQNWVNGSSPNTGLLLREPTETVNDVVQLTNLVDIKGLGVQMQLVVSYSPWLGEQSRYTLQKFPLSNQSKLLVNVANGNLELRNDDVNVQASTSTCRVTTTHSRCAGRRALSVVLRFQTRRPALVATWVSAGRSTLALMWDW